MRVTKTHFHFPAQGGERSAPHGLPIHGNATDVAYDPETMEITYTTPADPEVEGSEPTTHEISVTQTQIDDALVAANALTYVVPDLITNLWQDFNAHAESETDLNSRASISLILANPDSTAQQLQRAAEWGQWWSDLWTLYGTKRAEIVGTGAPVTYTLTPAPWTIWEIAG